MKCNVTNWKSMSESKPDNDRGLTYWYLEQTGTHQFNKILIYVVLKQTPGFMHSLVALNSLKVWSYSLLKYGTMAEPLGSKHSAARHLLNRRSRSCGRCTKPARRCLDAPMHPIPSTTPIPMIHMASLASRTKVVQASEFAKM
jgi:hypothetical protein